MSYESNKEWRHRFPKDRQAQTSRYYAKHRIGRTARGKRWSADEINFILAPENRTKGDVWISRQLNRSVQAIQVKRSKIGG